MACYGDSFPFFYVDDARTSGETRVRASMAYYGDSFTFFYVDDVRTSEVTRVRASMACYGDSFTFLFQALGCARLIYISR
jgi:hypothetical protein